MAQSFTIGQEVMVRDSYSSRRSPSFSKKLFVGFFKKSTGGGRFGVDKYTEIPGVGPYAGYRDLPRVAKCGFCDGTGQVVPEGFSSTATYRVKCTRCDGKGEQDFASKHVGHCANRSDLILSMVDYAPILLSKMAQKEREAASIQARETRVNTMISQLADVVTDTIEASLTDDTVDLELVLAKWLRNRGSDELRLAADRVIESRLPRCVEDGCDSAAANGESYAGRCYRHDVEARLRVQELEEATA